MGPRFYPDPYIYDNDQSRQRAQIETKSIDEYRMLPTSSGAIWSQVPDFVVCMTALNGQTSWNCQRNNRNLSWILLQGFVLPHLRQWLPCQNSLWCQSQTPSFMLLEALVELLHILSAIRLYSFVITAHHEHHSQGKIKFCAVLHLHQRRATKVHSAIFLRRWQ